MLIALTIYFYFFAAMNVINWMRGLTATPKLTPIVKAAKSEGERLALQGCSGAIVLPLASLMMLPLTYLQSVALPDLGFPAWIAWAVFGLNLLGAVFGVFKSHIVSGYIRPLPVLGYLLAWHGLQVLSR